MKVLAIAAPTLVAAGAAAILAGCSAGSQSAFGPIPATAIVSSASTQSNQMTGLATTPIESNATSGWVVEGPGTYTGGAFVPAVLTSPLATNWAAAIGTSSWISPYSNDGVANAPKGLYDYRYTFCTFDEKGQTISLSVLVDNAFDAKLNGHSFGKTPPGDVGTLTPMQVPQTVSTSAHFTIGLNTLDIIVKNLAFKHLNGSPTGLDVSGSVTQGPPSCD